MATKEKLVTVKREIGDLRSNALSVTEQNILDFIENQVNKEDELFNAFEQSVNEKKFNEALILFFQVIQRTNLMYSYIFQPNIISMLANAKIATVVQDLIDCLSEIVADVVATIKANIKEMGLESISVTMLSNPPSINITLGIKNA
ncbi:MULTISPECIES: hypothetical protein [Acidianus]|uniref:Uncharacterized protein n=1 Tax=Candidatus Acidianus copahuensis TaxID=1160895 RepID=A0A031LKL3_9CREN|nr:MULTISPECIES: hypothetical protein [Acidianus]EZQ02096.1 hypothetical protein CM19_11580 [Candidatus Acidianus copahuensis]NON62758.1 hypothetical protein [Acidianus sp. RZ1]